MLLVAFSCLILAAHVSCHSEYMSRIPNGHKVPNPQSPGTYWEASGHTTPDDGDGLNPFGEDFKHTGKQWTTELCQMDSDGDGKTNGAELGDPNCQWSPGSTPAGPATGHPGYKDNTGGGSGAFNGISLPQPESTAGSVPQCQESEHHHSHEKDKHHSHEKDKHHSHEKDKHHSHEDN